MVSGLNMLGPLCATPSHTGVALYIRGNRSKTQTTEVNGRNRSETCPTATRETGIFLFGHIDKSTATKVSVGERVSAKKLVVSIYLQCVLTGAATLVLFACEVPVVTGGGKSSLRTGGKEL